MTTGLDACTSGVPVVAPGPEFGPLTNFYFDQVQGIHRLKGWQVFLGIELSARTLLLAVIAFPKLTCIE